MVHRGRPSASCFACRARRKKCDKLRPECTQCVRTKMTCPGYLDPMDQSFRDESASVIKRATKNCTERDEMHEGCYEVTPATIVHLAERTKVGNPVDDFLIVTADSTPSSALTPAIEDVALSHFMTSYIPGRHFDYLPSIYAHLDSNSVLHSTVHAASVASLARKVKQPKLMTMARRSYAQALLFTNVVLADPIAATKDSTLISVLLLSLFEAIVWDGTNIPVHWATHSNGAFTLITMRGPQQLTTEVGREIFIQVANIIGVNHIEQRTRPPQDLLDLVDVAVQYGYDSPKCHMTKLFCEVIVLVADITEGNMSSEMVVEAISRMDEKYVTYTASLVSPWHYEEVVRNSKLPNMYSKTIHQYFNPRAAQAWNSYRMIRIMLNEALHGYAANLPTPIAHVIQAQAISNVQRMAVEICASVPYFTDPSMTSASNTEVQDALSLSILLPLSAVKHARLASPDVSAYAAGRVQDLALKADISGVGGTGTKFGGPGLLGSGFQMHYLS